MGERLSAFVCSKGVSATGKPSSPTPPNPATVSNAATKSNIDTASATAALQAVNQASPYGNVNFEPTGSFNVGGNQVPQWTQTISLSPEQQALYNKSTGLESRALDTAGYGLNNAQGSLSQPFSFSNLPQLQTAVDKGNMPALPGVNDFGAERQRVEDAYLGRFNTDIGRQQANTESQLNAQGLQRGTEAWNQAQDALNRERVDARNAAIQAGGAEQSRLYGLQSSARGQLYGEQAADTALTNQARQQGIYEQQLLRNQPINELATLLGLGSNVQMPTGAPNFGINVNPTNVGGIYNAAYQNQLGLAGNQIAASPWSGLGNLFSSLGSAAINKWG